MRLLAGVLALGACADDAVSPPAPPLPTYLRILAAQDSINAALRDFHAEGGRLMFVYHIQFPPETNMAPYIALSLKRP